MPRAAHSVRDLRFGLVIAWLVLAGSVTSSPAHAEENLAAVQKVTALNKKALEAYNNLDFEDARRILKQALELCSAAGLDRHPIKARTHIHMGVVLIATKQQDLGIKQFRKALEIQPDIQVTRSLANPEILKAFEEASEGAGSNGAGAASADETATSASGAAAGSDAGASAAGADAGIRHFAVARARKNAPISIVASVGPGLTGFAKLVLGYRAEGATDFEGHDMRASGGRYVGEIPAEATHGSVVDYFIEAEADNDAPVARAGSEDKPYRVALSSFGGGGAGARRGGEADQEAEEAAVTGGRFYVGVMGGWGTGYATGHGEVNTSNKVKAGFAPSSAAHVIPELGYFLRSDWRLSLQLRYQFVSGTTPLYLQKLDPPRTGCGSDNICTPASYAFAALARSSWFFGSDKLRPYFSLDVGAGQIRHVVSFARPAGGGNTGCGASGNAQCVDTVLAGPIFAGAGGGVFFAITSLIGVVGEINALLGFPDFTAHFDLNAGVAARF
jgi:hypothetical protein